MHTIRFTARALLLMLPLLAGGCMMMPSSHDNLPPVLTQDEILQPYEKLGRVQATREVYLFDPYPAAADAYAWGIQAIREEAAKMNADAVVLPEVTGHATMPVLPPSVLPVTEYHATGVAIRFK